MANYLLQNTSLNVHIVDYIDGALIKNCIFSHRLHFIEFRDFKTCDIDYETHLILHAGIPYKLRSELKIGDQVKILQWAAHEFNLVIFYS